jgi:uncharacterized protein
MNIEIAALTIYPVKSCAGVPAAQLVFGADGGIVGDRERVIVDDRGEVVWQGSHPALARVQPLAVGDRLRLTAAGAAAIDAGDDGAPVQMQAWNEARSAPETLAGRDAGDAVAAWLAAVTGTPLRLVRLAPGEARRCWPARIHVVGEPSLALVGDADVRRFRPNVVLRGGPLFAYAESRISRLAAGGGALRRAGDCVRCVTVDVDPARGTPDGRVLERLHALSASHLGAGPTRFGAYFVADGLHALTPSAPLAAEFDF